MRNYNIGVMLLLNGIYQIVMRHTLLLRLMSNLCVLMKENNCLLNKCQLSCTEVSIQKRKAERDEENSDKEKEAKPFHNWLYLCLSCIKVCSTHTIISSH